MYLLWHLWVINMGNKRGNIKTKKQDIVNYWIQYIDESDGMNFDWAEADKVCWRCGCYRKLQRCHIIPDSLGGKDEPSNFVLLCSECHQEAPNVESKTFMWDWIKSYYTPLYNTFWQLRAAKEYERIYHKIFFDELKERNIVTDHARYKFWNLKTGRTSYHFGHPYGNVSTIVGNYKLHLDAFDKKYPNKKYLSDTDILLKKQFESLTSSICYLAKKHYFSVWEGGTKNPYSLCISASFINIHQTFGISIKMDKHGNYKMCLCEDSNPNHLSVKSYNINFSNDNNLILERIELEIKKLILKYGEPYKDNLYFFVASPYWSTKN